MDVPDVLKINTIEFLKARYFRCLDTKDWSTFESTLADDVEVDHEALAGPKANGRANYVTRAQSDYDGAKTVHHGHMPEIRLTSANTAEGTWAMQVLTVKANGRRVLAFGHHRDSYAIRDGQWRITSTKATRLQLDES
ncbi:hypothetical protein GCM10023321_11760 [Pseudonocardia eucalypti]|uniref:SnoaL-like domain-containing protein n=1 Tax=Pseudonocardia eucalypti TaxID=648755 RepID=A0ABP9PQ94_9PSEU|nr:hypothetical protein [Pseudonocardia eucalypti]